MIIPPQININKTTKRSRQAKLQWIINLHLHCNLQKNIYKIQWKWESNAWWNLEILEWTSPEASRPDHLTFQCHKNQQCQRSKRLMPLSPMPMFQISWETHSEDPSSPATTNQPLKPPCYYSSHHTTPHHTWWHQRMIVFTFCVGQKEGNLRDLNEKDGVANAMGLMLILQTETAIVERWVKCW